MNKALLVSGKAAIIQAKLEEQGLPVETLTSQLSAIKVRPTALPWFDGNKRNFWKKDWDALQKQGNLTGSKEIGKFQLLDSSKDKVARDLRLSTYGTADEIFCILEKCFALEIVDDLQSLPPVKSR